MRAFQQVCRDMARLLGLRASEVFPSSTGIIGVPLPVKKIAAKLPDLVAARQATKQGVADFSRAIMTTDTRPKLACATFISGKTAVNILGRRMVDAVTLVQALGGGWDRASLPDQPECCGKLISNLK